MKRRHGDKRIVLGVTGSFGSGKSTVASMCMRLGAEVIDADKIAHKALAPKSRVHRKIVACFGKGILRKNGTIDRPKLGKIVFNDRRMRARLNTIVHGQVVSSIKAKLNSLKRGVIVLDVPLLIEAGLSRLVDKVIVVCSRKKIQIARLRVRTHLTRKDIGIRIAAQMPISKKIRVGDFIIDNSGTRSKTQAQVKKIWEKLHCSNPLRLPA